METIDVGPGDPRVAAFAGNDLGDGAGPGRFVVETELVVDRLLASPLAVDAILLTPRRLGHLAARLAARRDAGLADGVAPPTVFVASPPAMTAIVGFERHRGVAALAQRPPPVNPIDPNHALHALHARHALTWSIDQTKERTILVAEGIVDPHNLGTILRAARAFAVDLVLLDRRCADPWSRRASRAAVGNHFALHDRIARVSDLAATIGDLRRQLPGLVVAAATVDARATPLPTLAQGRPPDLALLLGNEGTGLAAATVAAADLSLMIPMAAGVDSLNVGAAAAILLYALRPAGV